MDDRRGNPYIPNANPATLAGMLERIGLSDAAGLFDAIPTRLRVEGDLDLPDGVRSEADLERVVGDLLSNDLIVDSHRCFLGGGCAPHYIPALCEEIVGRAEILTSYWGNVYSDHGKYQLFFEYASLIGELVGMDAASLPTYDWGSAAAIGLRMACRITGRRRVLVASAIGRERRAVIRTYLAPDINVMQLPTRPGSGTIDLDALHDALGDDVAAVYLETPNYLGTIDVGVAAAAEAAHAVGALVVGGCDPISLGVLAPPGEWGADIACGDLQALGIPMLFGGGLSGFIATRDEEHLVLELPTFLVGLTDTNVPGEHGFGLVAWDRTSYMRRENGKDFGGTTTGLWSVAAAVYLTLMGPRGMLEIGETIMQRRAYAARRLSELDGIWIPDSGAPRFKEFAVSYEPSGRSVADVNKVLRSHGLLGGHDVTAEDPSFTETALLCITEVHTKRDIDALVDAIAEAVAR